MSEVAPVAAAAAAPVAPPPQAPAAVAPTPVAASGSWTDSLNPEFKEYATTKGFKDPAAVLESYRNFEKLQGVPRERILKLPETAEATEWNEVYSKLGKPATPDGYGLKPADGGDPKFTDWAKSTFHKHNLTAEQGQKIVEQFQEFTAQQEADAKAQHTAQIQEQTGKLQKEWGSAFNQNVARAQAAYRTFGLSDGAIQALEQSIGFDGVMKFMLNLGEKIGEHSYIAGDNNPNFGDGAILTPVQAQTKINSLKQDAAFRERYLKGDVKARDEMEKLHKQANPGA
jgi:hypothetical protein